MGMGPKDPSPMPLNARHLLVHLFIIIFFLFIYICHLKLNKHSERSDYYRQQVAHLFMLHKRHGRPIRLCKLMIVWFCISWSMHESYR